LTPLMSLPPFGIRYSAKDQECGDVGNCNPMPLPKVISPRKHALLDALTIRTFLALGGIWWRRKRRPAVAALVNGLFVLGYTSLTDFDGDGKKPVSFKTHGISTRSRRVWRW